MKKRPYKAKLALSQVLDKYLNKKGVTICLDMDDSSEEAKAGISTSFSQKSKILTIVCSSLRNKNKALLLNLIKKVFAEGGLILNQKNVTVYSSQKEMPTIIKDFRISGQCLKMKAKPKNTKSKK